MDLIYEGITTHLSDLLRWHHSSEWTWFTKGLRQGLDLRILASHGQNGPDLRRDYDEGEFCWPSMPFRQNGPDLRRDYDGYPSLSNAIATFRQNGPDLRRDYDILMFGNATSIRSLSEWTWFTKGLRRNIGRQFVNAACCQNGPDLRRDYDDHACLLIYDMESLRQNGPDLRRDYDESWKLSICMRETSEWTWFTKGLRRSLVGHAFLTVSMKRQNGPDLRRDYDLLRWHHSCWHSVRMDLIYEGITTNENETIFFVVNERQNGPDLRRDYDVTTTRSLPIFYESSEWTWFTKGLRRFLRIVRFVLFLCQNGPDLRRDYDFGTVTFHTHFFRQNGPDLRRDYDDLSR